MPSEDIGRCYGFHPQALFAKAVFALDRQLQINGGVFCYTSDERCLFRIALTRLDVPAVLDCWTALPEGTLVAELHLWNEQLPVLSEHESLIAWALTMSRRMTHSLRLLSAYLAERPDLSCVCALRADISLGTVEMTARLLSLAGRYGFIPCSESRGDANFVRRLGGNILISMMMLARNASAFRLSALRRTRVLVFMPREELDRRYGNGERSGPVL